MQGLVMSEQNLNFDVVVDRRNTQCLKYDFAQERGYSKDVLPLWVADMDFKTSSYIVDELKRLSDHGIYGYSDTKDDYFDIVAAWQRKYHGWTPTKNSLIKTPGVVFALAMAVKSYTDVGDSVLIQSPVYYPFTEVITDNNRVVVSSDLVLGSDNIYHMDFEDFEKKIIDNNVKLFLLCNPHNPVGRVWTKEELTTVGDICLKHNVIVVSDEIHSDFTFEGCHNVFASIKKEYEDISVICTSATKTFNLASTLVSNIFIPNEKLYKAFKKQVDAAGISQLSIFGIVATKTAYTKGEEWYEAVKKYIKSNVDFVQDYVSANLKGVKMIKHQGTYLIWLDFRGTGLSVDEIEDLIVNKARLWLDSGKIFGKQGECFERINVACPRSVLKEALDRIKNALE